MIELSIPPAAEKDPKSVEVLRVWVADKSQHVTIRADLWRNPEAWGIVLADLLRHVANAYQQQSGLKFDETVQVIKDMFDREMSSPTDHARGKISGK
jgi:hypothetical protein